MIPIPLIIKKEQEITAGKGVYSATTHSGSNRKTVFYADPQRPFRGAWYMTGGLIGMSNRQEIKVWLDRGYVNALMPVIDGTPIAPIDGSPPPAIVGKAEFDAEGRAWVGIRVGIDPSTGKMKNRTQASLTDDDLTIVIQNSPIISSQQGEFHFHPIACVPKEGSPFQISYFDYQWGVSKQGSVWRHFLIPA
jgi:hypothetical protein